jgi:hypothetical protein
MVLFIRKKYELKIRKRCMRLRKIGVCEVMMDKEMKGGLQYMDDE